MRVSIDSNRNTRIDEKPFFLLGARHTPLGATPELLADAGFNAYRKLAFGHDIAEPEPPPYPDEPLRFWTYLYDRTVLSRDPSYRRQLEKYVKSVREHPNLLCYENTNEVARFWKGGAPSVTPEELVEGTQLVRELDPNHPIWISHTRHRMAETLSAYNIGGDITGCNCFPVTPTGMRQHIGVRGDGRVQDCPDPSVHSMGLYTRKMLKVGQGKLAVWMQIQAMAYENWFNETHAPEMAGQTVDESKILYPDYHQLRFMCYDAVVCGATGLAFAMYKTPVESQMWKDVRRMVTELRGLEEALAADPYERPVTVTHEDLGYSIWEGVLTLAKRTGDDLFVFAVNTAFDPARVTIDVADSAAKVAFAEIEEREISIESGRFKDDFAPYETRAYRIPLKD